MGLGIKYKIYKNIISFLHILYITYILHMSTYKFCINIRSPIVNNIQHVLELQRANVHSIN